MCLPEHHDPTCKLTHAYNTGLIYTVTNTRNHMRPTRNLQTSLQMFTVRITTTGGEMDKNIQKLKDCDIQHVTQLATADFVLH